MREALTELPKVGDKLVFIGESSYLTNGNVYVVAGYDDDGEPFIYDNDVDREYIRCASLANFEKVVELPPTNGILEVYVAPADLEELADNGDMFIEVRVNAEGHALLEELAKAHEKAIKAAELSEQIEKLKEELKSL